ncbi:MAG: AI-2E family transporter [Porphyromonas sp.]|nr:AI-2E family transporter [Porphyromonas sp.]
MLTDFLERPFTFDRVVRIIFVLLIVAAFIWVFDLISAVLVPFFLAWFCAYLLMPLVRFSERRLKIKKRLISMLLVLLLVAGVITGIITILVPSISAEVKRGWELIQYYDLQSMIVSLLPEEYQHRTVILEKMEEMMASIDIEQALNAFRKVLTSGWDVVSGTFQYLMGFGVVLLFLIYLVFILLDYESLNKGFFLMMPPKIRPLAHEIVDEVELYINSYFKGQALIALCVGVVMTVGFYIIGLPLGITLGLLMGVLNLVPYLQAVGYIPLMLLALLQSASTGQSYFVVLLMGVIVMVVSDLIQNLVLIPSIHSQGMGMKPAIIILSLVVWGALFGFLGMLFALPLTMICYSLYMRYVVGEPIQNGRMVEPANKPRWPFRRKMKKEEKKVEK